MSPLSASHTTPAANAWLQMTTAARVLNVFDRACNLVNQDGAVLALVTSAVGLTPFGVVVRSDDDTLFRMVSSAAAVGVSAGRITVAELEIHTGTTQEWNPAPDWTRVAHALHREPALVDELAAAAARTAPPGSLLELLRGPGLHGLPAGAAILRPAGALPEARLDFLDRAVAGAHQLLHGLDTGLVAPALAGAQALAGLGGGLTPAGDDFVVGALLATWSVPGASPLARLRQPIADAVAPLTTTLSAAYVRAAARGECTAHWHRLLNALGAHDSWATREALSSLLSVGHTSGADALAGYLAALKVFAQFVPVLAAVEDI